MHSYVYCLNMDKDIENIVKFCKAVLWQLRQPQSNIVLSLKRTDHVDFAGPLDGFYYLIVVDSFSKYPEVLRCRNPTTKVTINFHHKLFTRFGVVDCLVSDNGIQFTSGDFKDFCVTFQINHITIAPYHPRSNGQAECFVDTQKRTLKKDRGTLIEKPYNSSFKYKELRPMTTHYHYPQLR